MKAGETEGIEGKGDRVDNTGTIENKMRVLSFFGSQRFVQDGR